MGQPLGSDLPMGLLLGCIAGAGALVGLEVATDGPPAMELSVRGAEVSAHGGAQVFVEGERARLVQHCNGMCDDLDFDIDAGENSFRVRVLDTRGSVSAQGGPGYVTSGLRTRVVVGGVRALEVSTNP